jgi:hypothetical protein
MKLTKRGIAAVASSFEEQSQRDRSPVG